VSSRDLSPWCRPNAWELRLFVRCLRNPAGAALPHEERLPNPLLAQPYARREEAAANARATAILDTWSSRKGVPAGLLRVVASVELARALATNQLLLLDEPAAGPARKRRLTGKPLSRSKLGIIPWSSTTWIRDVHFGSCDRADYGVGIVRRPRRPMRQASDRGLSWRRGGLGARDVETGISQHILRRHPGGPHVSIDVPGARS
jgi:hypothetical protein